MINEYIKKWLIKAMHDLKNIEISLKQEASVKKDLTDTICFHSQQAVEKMLKSYLVFNKMQITKTHDLDFLLQECRKIDKDFNNIDVGNLTDYGVEARYPDDFYMPTIVEAEESLNIVLKIKEFIFNKLHIKEEDLINLETKEEL